MYNAVCEVCKRLARYFIYCFETKSKAQFILYFTVLSIWKRRVMHSVHYLPSPIFEQSAKSTKCIDGIMYLKFPSMQMMHEFRHSE